MVSPRDVTWDRVFAGIGYGFDAQTPRSLLLALDPRPRDNSAFAASSVLIMLVVFVALLLTAGYLGHVMAL
jgi:hypothetical protein